MQQTSTNCGIIIAHPSPNLMAEMTFAIEPPWLTKSTRRTLELLYNPERDGSYISSKSLSIQLFENWIVTLLTVTSKNPDPKTQRRGQDIVIGIYSNKNLHLRYSNVLSFSFAHLLISLRLMENKPLEESIEFLLSSLTNAHANDDEWIYTNFHTCLENIECGLFPDPMSSPSYLEKFRHARKVNRFIGTRKIIPISSETLLLKRLENLDEYFAGPMARAVEK